MPAKKTTRKKSNSSKAKISPMRSRSMASQVETYNEPMENSSPSGRRLFPILLAIPFVLAVLALILWKNKGWVVAATVNGQPIWRWNLEQRFVSRYGNQTVDEMINEQILKSEAAKQGVKISSADIDNKIKEIEKTLQGRISLKDALTQQGMTMDDFRNQVELQVLIEKLTANKVSVSDKEIDDYITSNKEMMTATEAAAMKNEAKTALLQQKRNQTFQSYFANLKKNAKVTKFL